MQEENGIHDLSGDIVKFLLHHRPKRNHHERYPLDLVSVLVKLPKIYSATIRVKGKGNRAYA